MALNNSPLAFLKQLIEEFSDSVPIEEGRIESKLHQTRASGPNCNIKHFGCNFVEPNKKSHYQGFGGVQNNIRMEMEEIAKRSFLKIGNTVVPLEFGVIAGEIKGATVSDFLITFRVSMRDD